MKDEDREIIDHSCIRHLIQRDLKRARGHEVEPLPNKSDATVDLIRWRLTKLLARRVRRRAFGV